MPEIIRPLLPVEINYYCDSCGSGVMERKPGALQVVSAAGFDHICNYCGTAAKLGRVYPYTKNVNFYGFLQDAAAAIAAAK